MCVCVCVLFTDLESGNQVAISHEAFSVYLDGRNKELSVNCQTLTHLRHITFI